MTLKTLFSKGLTAKLNIIYVIQRGSSLYHTGRFMFVACPGDEIHGLDFDAFRPAVRLLRT